MNIETFKSLLEAYGADFRRWPEAMRAEAKAFVEASVEAANLLAAEAAFDRVLDAAQTASVTRALEERILASFPERGAAAPARGSFAIFAGAPLRWAQAAALAVSLALGLAVGAALPSWAGVGEAAEIDPALVALGDLDTDLWNDMGGS
jgi:hypothetical protein